MPNSLATRRTETCRSRMVICSTASLFSSIVMVDGRSIRGASLKLRSGSSNSATHLAMVRYDGEESLQILSSSLLILMAFNPFLVKNLMTGRCSMFDIFEK